MKSRQRTRRRDLAPAIAQYIEDHVEAVVDGLDRFDATDAEIKRAFQICRELRDADKAYQEREQEGGKR